MKKVFVLSGIVVCVIIFSNCHSSKKAAGSSAAPKLNYEANIRPIVSEKCSPCHIPAKGGNKKAFDTYEAVKANIDSMISRITLNPGQKGFMPFRKAKLGEDTIAVFKQWRSDALMEK